MHALCDVFRLLSAASLGLYVGAMLTEGFVLVTYWRSLPPAQFLAWYAANDQRLVGFFGPLTTATVLVAITAAVTSVWEGHPGRRAAVIAAVLMIALLASFFLYFRGANARFAAGTIRADDVPAALARWGSWHWARTGISAGALASALLAIWQGL